MSSDKYQSVLRQCFSLALSAQSRVSPNPKVGAIIEKNGNIIGTGFHQGRGSAHAEVAAINSVTDKSLLAGSTIYVNLEPCAHFGNTPPCTKAIIEAGISNCIIGCQDSNPAVCGKGIAALQANGISVSQGVLAQEAKNLNRRFLTYHELKRPYIILKWAETKDGFIAKSDGSSKWISNETSRHLVHIWRAEEAAIMVGRNTVAIDNPKLTARNVPGTNPIRIAFDRDLALAKSLNIFDDEAKTLLFNSKQNEPRGNTELIKIDYSIDTWSQILAELHKREVLSVLVEGGASLLQQLIVRNLWDEARVFTSANSFGSGLPAPRINGDICLERGLGGDQLIVYKNPTCLFAPFSAEFTEL